MLPASISFHANTNDTLNCRDMPSLFTVPSPVRRAELPTHKAQVSLTNYDDDKISSPDEATQLPEKEREWDGGGEGSRADERIPNTNDIQFIQIKPK